MNKFFGIAGGMGPEASLKLCEYLLQGKKVHCDQDHEPYILFNNPSIPDRTAHILGKGPSPVDGLVSTVKTLEKSGCQFVLIPCNTAHFFLDEVKTQVKVPIIHMIKETVNEILELSPKPVSIGLLATTGTLKTGLYTEALRNKEVEILLPREDFQENSVMKAIYNYKGGKTLQDVRETLDPAVADLEKRGAEYLIAGCTELSCIFEPGVYPKLGVVDPLRVLAKRALTLSHRYS